MVGGRTVAVLWSAVSRTCLIFLAAFSCNCRQASSPYGLLASTWCIHIAVSIQLLLGRNCTSGDISMLNGTVLKLVDKFTYLGSSVSSTKTDISTWLAKAWTAIDRLLVVWKSDLTDKMNRSSRYLFVIWIQKVESGVNLPHPGARGKGDYWPLNKFHLNNQFHINIYKFNQKFISKTLYLKCYLCFYF